MCEKTVLDNTRHDALQWFERRCNLNKSLRAVGWKYLQRYINDWRLYKFADIEWLFRNFDDLGVWTKEFDDDGLEYTVEDVTMTGREYGQLLCIDE